MSLIKAVNLSFSYDSLKAINNLNIEIPKGSFVALTGKNGCGKSTFAKMLNALLVPQNGQLFVNGLDTSDSNNTVVIRKTVGLVFQNPENQIVGETVEEDVAFGPENMGLDSREIEIRITNALEKCGISNIRYSNTAELSGGEKQKVAIAGILAMRPSCIVLDESLSMLDNYSKAEILNVLKNLNREGMTVILITHDESEMMYCDKIINFEEAQNA